MPYGFDDPLAEINQLIADPVGASLRRSRRPALGMPPEQYDSLLGNLTGAPMSALAWLGGTLDKPNRAIRGLLGGRPEELANLIPFSDTLGITDSEGLLGGTPLQVSDRENALSGRDLLRQTGLIGEEDNWGNFAAGLGVEMLTDPLTYLTMGTGSALTKGGQVLSKAGLLPAKAVERLGTTLGKSAPNLLKYANDAANPWITAARGSVDDFVRSAAVNAGDEATGKLLTAAKGSGMGVQDLLGMADEPVSALASYGIGPYQKYFGLGEAGLPAGQMLDKASDAVRWSAPGKLAAKLFNPDVLNRSEEVTQRAAQDMTDAIGPIRSDIKNQAAGLVSGLADAGITDDTWKDIAFNARERTWPQAKNLTLEQRQAAAQAAGKPLTQMAMEESLRARGVDPAAFDVADIARSFDEFDAKRTATREEAAQYGLPSQMLDDAFVSHTHRQLEVDDPTKTMNRAFQTSGLQDAARIEPFRNIPGGTDTLQRIFDDPAINAELQSTREYSLKTGATRNQLKYLSDIGVDVTDLKKWQAQDLIAQHKNGVPAEQLSKVRLPPSPPPKVPTKAIEMVMKTIDSTKDSNALERLRDLQRTMREGPGLADSLRDLPAIPEPVYKAFESNGYLPEDVDELFQAGGWDEVARVMSQELRGDSVKEMRDAMGLMGGKQMLSEAQDAEYTALLAMYNQARDIARFSYSNPGAKWSKEVILSDLNAHLSDAQKLQGMKSLMTHVGKAAVALPVDEAASQQIMQAMQAAADLPTKVEKLLEFKRPVPDGQTRLVEAFTNMGLDSSREAKAATITKLAEHLAEAGVISPQTAAAIQAGDGMALTALDNLVIPTPIAKDMKGFIGGLNMQKELNPLLGVFDTITNTIKNHLTAPFPSFSMRNLVSLAWQDGVAGGFQDPYRMADSWKKAWKLVRGEGIDGLDNVPGFAGKTPQEKAVLLSNLSYAHGVSPHGINEGTDLLGNAPVNDSIKAQLPGGSFKDYNPLSDLRPTSLQEINPLAVRGGVSRDMAKSVLPEKWATTLFPEANDVTTFAPSRAGENFNTLLESLGRNATFIRNLEAGMDPALAAMQSKVVHVDFGKLSQFERDVMKRIIPFYTFTRHALPYQLQEILTHPGGLTAQSIRATTQDDQGFIPEQAVGSIPMGNEENGNRRFLNLDLPFNVINDVAGGGQGVLGTLQQTGYRGLSQLNPLLKAPLELVTGQSFFQRGRPLQDLYSRTGLNNTLADTAIMNSPLSRYVSTGSMLTDNRKSLLDKAVNLATGLRISDVDVERSRDKAAAQSAMQLLGEGGAETFTRMYFPADYQPTLEEQQLMALLTEQARRRRNAAKVQ